MRLIDADALLEELKKTDRYFQAKFDIENAPTIDITEIIGRFRNTAYQNGLTTGLNKRPRGEWKEFIMPVPVSDNHYKIGVICSECNTTWDCKSNYCPYCGADMGGITE